MVSLNHDPDVFVAIGVSLGQKARMARVALDLRQVDVADLADVAQAHVSALERNVYVIPSIRRRILAALGLTDDEEGQS